MIYEGGHTTARNPTLQMMFRLIGYGENIDSGFSQILKTWESNSWICPDLSDDLDRHSVRLTLWMTEILPEEAEIILWNLFGSDYQSLSPNQLRVLGLAALEKSVSMARLKSLGGFDYETAELILETLEQQRFLLRSASSKKIRWCLNSQYKTAANAKSQSEKSDAVSDETSSSEAQTESPKIEYLNHLILNRVQYSLSSTDLKVIELFRTADSVSSKDVMEKIDKIHSYSGAYRALSRLLAKKIIRKEKRGGIWFYEIDFTKS